MDRREFIQTSVWTGLACLVDFDRAFAAGQNDKSVGKPWRGWKKGQFQVHFIYTGVAESMFYIFPDGTTMLLDCGDHNAIGRGKLAVPVLPNPDRHAGEWIARYVQRVNPSGSDVDYMMLSHYHSDHAGCSTFYASKDRRDEQDYFLSGFSQAAESLNFGKAFDRSWPTYDDPIPINDESDGGTVGHMKRFYEYMQKHRGMQMEKFKLGAVNQIAMLKNPSEYKNFSVRNICANGSIAYPDGTVKDLYKDRIAKEHPKTLNENGMSLGMIFTYGEFKFYTAGDFSDKWKLPDGAEYEIEDAIADACDKVNVAKINHHGHYSMPRKLIEALQARVYVSCVWDQLHNVAPVMERLADRSIYPDDRIICPGIFPNERREEDAGKIWMSDINKDSFDGGHIILNVEPDGKRYSITYLTADDESMTVKSVIEFNSR